MPTKKLAITDSIVYGDGVTPRQGVSADRNVSIGDNSSSDLFLLENGDFLLQEDGSGRFLRDVVMTLEND